jgi:hypothetical protein
MESRQPLILLTCDGTATFPWVWSYFSEALFSAIPPFYLSS